MGLSIEALSADNAAEWDDLVRASPDGWVFSLAGWQRLTISVTEWGFEDHSFALREGARLVAVMPLQYRPSHKVMGSSGWGGSGPVIAADRTGAAREHLFAACVEEATVRARNAGAEKLEMSCSPVTRASIEAPWAVNPFALRGLDDCSRLSQVIDLSVGAEALWDGLSKSARQAIRTAEKAGITCRRVSWTEWLDRYYAVHCETYARDGLAPHPKSYFTGIAQEIAPSDAAILWAAFDPQGEVIAFHNEARMGGGAYYHTGCSTGAARGDGAAYLLVWRAIEGAAKDGVAWYDMGWIFPGSADEKQRGLTLFKTRFGGEPHRAFHAAIAIEKITKEIESAAEITDAISTQPIEEKSASKVSREAYEAGEIYKVDTICNRVKTESPEYVDRLLVAKIALVRKHKRPGPLLDLCCATGEYLFNIADENEEAIGVDFSRPFIKRALEINAALKRHITFAAADAKALPLADKSIGTLYSFSSLYAIPGVEDVFTEIGRVLAPGGRAILDLGNSRSLNSISVKAYTELPPTYHMLPERMRELATANGMRVVEHRAFQILPLWSDRPKWMGLLLHPRWKPIMATKIGGRMIDEWVSNLPFLKPFAFRHMLICEKI